MEGTEAMGVALTDSRSVGGGPPDFRELLQVGGSGKPSIRHGDLSHVYQYWEDPHRVPPQGGPPAGGNAVEAVHVGHVGLPTTGRGNDGSGFGVGGDVCNPPIEYHHQVYCNSSDTGAMSVGKATNRSTCDLTVVGSGHTKLCTQGR